MTDGGSKAPGRIALVTGATSGIGEAVTRTFARQGWKVLATGRNKRQGARLIEELGEAHCGFKAADLFDSGIADRLVQDAVARFGALDVLVNSAGMIHHADSQATSDDLWRRHMVLNVDIPFYLARAAIGHMKGRGGGAIVNVSSEWGLVGAERAVAYCASKGAIIQMTRAMALDHGADGITVNAVCPGGVDTPMLAAEAKLLGMTPDEARAHWSACSPNKRIATAQDIANAVLFLASDSARHINGVALPVDGGNIAR